MLDTADVVSDDPVEFTDLQQREWALTMQSRPREPPVKDVLGLADRSVRDRHSVNLDDIQTSKVARG